MTLAPVPPARGDHAVGADQVDGSGAADAAPSSERRNSLGKITTRPSVAEDSAFMLELYASTSKDVLDDLGWSIGGNRTFVIMQAQTEEWNRARLYPGMDRLTICVDEMPVGKLLVCLRNNILHLVDLSLLPRFRGLGIGTQLVGEILDEARNARVPVKVRVLKNSSGLRFVERLGFATPTDLGRYVELTWMPPLTALGPDAHEEGFEGHGTRANRPVVEETLEPTPEADPVVAADFAAFAPIEPIEATTPMHLQADPPATTSATPAPVADEAELPTLDTVADLAVDQTVEPVAEVAAELAEDVAEALAEDVTQDVAEDVTEEVAEDVAEDPINETNEAVLAYIAEAQAESEYIAEPVWLAPDVVIEEEPEVVEEEEEPEVVEEDPEVVARRAEYLEAVTATDAFTSTFTSTFAAEVSEDDEVDETLPPGADRYDPFA